MKTCWNALKKSWVIGLRGRNVITHMPNMPSEFREAFAKL